MLLFFNCREEAAFNKKFHECPICFCMKPGTECLQLGKCGHIFCKECLSGFLSVHIAEGSVNNLTCLVDKCDSQIYPNVVCTMFALIFGDLLFD